MDTTELRRCQAELYESIMKLDPDRMERVRKHMEVLDKDIIFHADSHCRCGYNLECTLLEEIDQGQISGVSECIRDGECTCRSEEDSVHQKTNYVAVTFVHLAVATNNTELLHLLTSRGHGCHIQTRLLKLSPIFIAVYRRHKEATDFLLSKDLDINVVCGLDNHVTPLMQAIQLDDVDCVQKLVQTPGVDVNIRNKGGVPPVMVSLNNKAIFDMLVDAGADVNSTIKNGYITYNDDSLLMQAVTKGQDYVTKLLNKGGVDVNYTNSRNQTALHVAVHANSKHIVKALLNAKANPDTVISEHYGTAIAVAASAGDLPLVEIMVKHGADINIGNSNGYNAVHWAALFRHTHMLKLLLESEGVEHDKLTTDANSPLALAAYGKHGQAVEMLLPLGCKVNNKDKDGYTALHYATYNGMTDTVRLLLQYGADPDVKSSHGVTPLWNAVYGKHTDMVKLLLGMNVVLEVMSRGVNQRQFPTSLYPTAVSPLYVAVHQYYVEIFYLLLSAGYDLSKEQWIFEDNIHPDAYGVAHLTSVLRKRASEPPRLLTICRDYFRRHGNRRKFKELVESLGLPISLKNYLLLTELLKESNVKTK